MRLLADTHSFLWFVEGDPQLSTPARRLIEDGNNEIYLSVASVWEMAIKVSIGKLAQLTLTRPFGDQIAELLDRNSIALLPISLPHVLHVATLPLHHRDPFDRLLVSQCLIEPIPLISTDTAFDAYGVQRFW